MLVPSAERTPVPSPVRAATGMLVRLAPLPKNAAPVMFPAAKFPDPSRATMVDAVLALVASDVSVTGVEPL